MNNNYKRLAVKVLLCLAVFLLIISFSSPYRLPLIAVVLPTLPLVLAVVYATRLLLSFFGVNEKLFKPVVYVVSLMAGITIVLLSLGQLTFRDFFLLLSLGLVLGFYMTRMFASTNDDL
ncbi:hypothetical protein EB118_02550 [bacterium]|nr:hypothetical protein [bacterium]NDC95025.1 hypothetical protein [bacterium]NDD84732.1 hypothetical protein [bacterium]NDG28964.1 hypothetical protein [bacterium]